MMFFFNRRIKNLLRNPLMSSFLVGVRERERERNQNLKLLSKARKPMTSNQEKDISYPLSQV